MQVYELIASVMADIAKVGIGKNQINSHQKFKYRGIDDMYNTIAPILSAHKLCILPRVVSKEYQQLETRSGGASFRCVLHVEFDIVAPDGSKHTVSSIGEAMDTSDKATNKAMSIAYKYMALMTFAIPVVGDDDADAHTPEPVLPAKEKIDIESFRETIIEGVYKHNTTDMLKQYYKNVAAKYDLDDDQKSELIHACKEHGDRLNKIKSSKAV